MKKGSRHSPESLERMRIAKQTPEAIARVKIVHTGKVVSEQSKEKNRLWHYGRKDSEETKERKRISHLGKNNHMYGKSHTEIAIEKMRKPKTETAKEHISNAKKGIMPSNIEDLKYSRLGSHNSKEHISNQIIAMHKPRVQDQMSVSHRGERNANWNGGISPLYKNIRESRKYYEWRDAVYKRDNYADVITGERGNGNLNAHHLIPFATLLEVYHIETFEQAMACDALWDVSNGITLIDKNHVKLHSTGAIETPE